MQATTGVRTYNCSIYGDITPGRKRRSAAHRVGSERTSRTAPGSVARHPGRAGLCSRRRRSHSCRGLEPLARGGPWRGHLLSLLSPLAPGCSHGEPVPGRGLPVDGRRGPGGARPAPSGHRLSPDQRRRTLLARANLLSGQLRLLARGDDRRPAVWAGHARALRCAGCRLCSLAMTTLVYVPADAGALSLGAGEVARSIVEEAARRRAAVKVVRNGSRGGHLPAPASSTPGPR